MKKFLNLSVFNSKKKKGSKKPGLRLSVNLTNLGDQLASMASAEATNCYMVLRTPAETKKINKKRFPSIITENGCKNIVGLYASSEDAIANLPSGKSAEEDANFYVVKLASSRNDCLTFLKQGQFSAFGESRMKVDLFTSHGKKLDSTNTFETSETGDEAYLYKCNERLDTSVLYLSFPTKLLTSINHNTTKTPTKWNTREFLNWLFDSTKTNLGRNFSISGGAVILRESGGSRKLYKNKAFWIFWSSQKMTILCFTSTY